MSKMTCYVLLNHQLGDQQVAELEGKGFQIVVANDEVKNAWGQITPDNLDGVVAMVKESLPNGTGAVVVQGHFAATFRLVRDVKALGIECFYAHSVRQSVDQPQADGTVKKVAVFNHVGFFPY